MFALIFKLCAAACIIFASISANGGDVAKTILHCFYAVVFIWCVEKLKEGGNDG